ncbi:Hypothetical Protein SLY_0772 [Strawberry lethal yellows phytoplasma (CPA) str. NZSb11]|uniref:Uncharacterized protein n=1 Tax=Strawberry lethal yellows phytoplasma (CPA) str. NZSb11 TaxID=980422 RepID=R4RQA4_PHYAS|nr:Hypothetical Protein SLY_0068 [Strawberry lethal yellows phytoplasma (CPA) str. NZSb11]AGL90038.1 Hypothetical Protein SLY_0115 [Strawberry lethal yellows phytoplasma (CPA) str. NZSb11]AGL90633.1 Hypothetical Protein SLY_0719 [Strawberry lethal yellows phytoplasma (CPA) str. NZSb11]AGL90686.1 Hypothetical Protein SLY_0772 [Strawberry lethal yellows phytoplasma (CPA) str. NZSb11]
MTIVITFKRSGCVGVLVFIINFLSQIRLSFLT